MARRIIGDANVYMRLDDWGRYHCTISVHGHNVYVAEIRPPAGSGHFNDIGFGIGIGADAPDAFDQMAAHAVAFGVDDGPDGNHPEHAATLGAATDWAILGDGSYLVRRPSRRRASDMSRA